jgi:type IV pilus assembly protein PilC
MPNFRCRLAGEDGQVFSQTYLAPTARDCRRYYEERGLCVLSVRRDWKELNFSISGSERGIRDKDFIMFNQELVALIKAGYPILKSIEIIMGRTKSDALKELLMVIEENIREGQSLSEAFRPYEKDFSTVYIASLMAGERSGNLAGTLKRFITYAQVIERTKSRIKSALTYPTILIVFSFILLGILINFILPNFANFYQAFETKLPAITRGLLSFAFFARSNLSILVIIALIGLFFLYRGRKKENVRILIDRMKLKVPYGRKIWLESAVSLFSRTLSLLLEGGITLVQSVSIARQAVPNSYLIQKMKDLPNHIKNGETLSESLRKSDFFSPLALDMIRIGESSANLEGMLADVADVYDDRVQQKIDTFVSLIEPIVIIGMGLVVAAMLLSVYLPIFNIIRVTQ